MAGIELPGLGRDDEDPVIILPQHAYLFVEKGFAHAVGIIGNNDAEYAFQIREFVSKIVIMLRILTATGSPPAWDN
jgi:hypothetical protein